MILSVIGTQCVGKSTFINDFVKKYPEFKTPEIDYRSLILKKNLQINRNGNYRSQKAILDFLITQMLSLSKDNNNYIIDRSVIDSVAYSTWLNLNKPYKSTYLGKAKLFKLQEKAKEFLNLYDYFIYIPLSLNNHVQIENDMFRDTDSQYRIDIDKIFNDLLSHYNLINSDKLIKIYGSPEQRIQQISNIIIK